jgi:transposase
LVVDTLGLVWAVVVTPASVQDWDGGRVAMLKAELAAPGLRRVFADSAYVACRFWAAQFARVIVFIVRKPPGRGLTVQPKRWVVERTFGWLGRWRRLDRDHERTCESTEAFVTVAMIGLMARRLKPAKHG